MQDKTIFFFCYRMLEFKLFVNTEILQYIVTFANLVVFVPDDFCETCREICPKGVKVLPLNHPSFKLGTQIRPTFKLRLEGVLRNTLSLTYANNGPGQRCHSYKPQLKAFVKAKSNLRPIRRGISRLIVWLAMLASNFYIVRKSIQGILTLLLSNNNHKEAFDHYKPSLVVVGSLGLDVDGKVIAEAKACNVKSLVINQSWDRMVTRGYPTVQPDYIIVWNDHMKEEAERYLDCPPSAVFVDGASPFDFIFREKNLKTKKVFFNDLNLDPKKNTFLFALPSSYWHQDSLETLERLGRAIREDTLLAKTQFIIRLHPFYWNEPIFRKQIFNKLEKFNDLPNVAVDINKVTPHTHSAFISREDQLNLLSYYKHCDACMTQASTVMIEMSCFKKPTLNMLYGNWVTSNESIPIKEYNLHHLVELQKYSTITNCDSFETLIDEIKAFDSNNIMEEDLTNFIMREIGPNRGKAGLAAAKRLQSILLAER